MLLKISNSKNFSPNKQPLIIKLSLTSLQINLGSLHLILCQHHRGKKKLVSALGWWGSDSSYLLLLYFLPVVVSTFEHSKCVHARVPKKREKRVYIKREEERIIVGLLPLYPEIPNSKTPVTVIALASLEKAWSDPLVGHLTDSLVKCLVPRSSQVTSSSKLFSAPIQFTG